MRIAVGGFLHETNTFAPSPATWEDFAVGGAWPAAVRGPALMPAVAGINMPITGAIGVLEKAGAEVVPLAWSAASPSAHVTDDAFERMAAMIVDALCTAGPVDGVYLDLHGAMVTVSHDDGEGELLRRVRAVAGATVPIVASLDLHANITRAMVDHSDALIAFRTYPHVDMDVTGARSAERLLALIAGSAGRAKAWRQAPFLIPLTWGCTGVEPARSLYARIPALERDGASVSLAAGFPAADIADCGPSVVAYAGTQAEADRLADQLMGEVIAQESAFAGRLYDADEAVRAAVARSEGAGRPVVLADTQDNPGAGGNADTVWLLEALVRQRAPGAVVGVLYDVDAAAACHAAGAGATVDLALGARCAQPGHAPLRGRFRVERLGDGEFTATGPMFLGSRMRLGPMALVEIDGVRAVLASRKAQAADQSMFRHVGVEPARQRIVALKSSVHFRADFEPIAAEVLVVATPGPMPVDPGQLPFRRLRPGVRRSPRRG
ncbi:MAG TPA: M81 family metallopeptidase [Planctomycetota bacterium]|nr:M81 family metallopeptidase [Planctomycetota bacterium]